jgi:SAM-dependent methyltransferase
MIADRDALLREKAELEARHGAWTAHNIRLAEGVYTRSPAPAGDEVKLRRVTQVVSDLCNGSLEGVRVLDLACLEGMYALELAQRGAEVVGIEGRAANVEKSRFAARALGLDAEMFVQDDIRNLSSETYGEFDVVLALGILYHLDVPDLFDVVARIAASCRRALVVDTSVGARRLETVDHRGRSYRGRRLVEHAPDSTADERLGAVWSSLDNTTAFALTRASLETLLGHSGFTSVYECHVPAEPGKEVDRVTLVALKGTPVVELLSPTPPESAAEVPERAPLARWIEASGLLALGRHAVPRPLRAHLRRLLGTETRRH